MANEYGLGDLSFKGQIIRTVTGTETFQMKVWGGAFRVGIVKEKEFKPMFERALAPDKVTILKHTIQKIMKASPNTKIPLVFSQYDREQKKPVIDFVLTFLKDDKNLYHIEMQWKGNKFDCLLKGPFGVAYGSEPMTDAERSAIEIETMYDWICNIAPFQCMFTNRKREFDGNANGSTYTANKGTPKNPMNDAASVEDDFPF